MDGQRSWTDRVASEAFNPREVSLAELNEKESEAIARSLRFVDKAREINPAMTQQDEAAVIASNPILQLPPLPESEAGRKLEDLLGAIVHMSEKNIINPNAFVRQGIVAEAKTDSEFWQTLEQGWKIIDDAKSPENPVTSQAAQQLEGIIGEVLQNSRGKAQGHVPG